MRTDDTYCAEVRLVARLEHFNLKTSQTFTHCTKAIEVKLTEIYTCTSPPYGEDCGRNDQLPDNL